MHVLFQTSTNSLRQKEQDLVKDGWQKIGIETELKSVDASIYFARDPGNPDTYAHFSTDAEMFTSTPDTPFPVFYMKRLYGANPETDWAQKSNNWSGTNMLKWSNADYNKLYEQVRAETDTQKASQMWQQMNDIAVNAYVVVPLVDRKTTDAKIKGLQGPNPGPFDNWSWNIAEWTRTWKLTPVARQQLLVETHLPVDLSLHVRPLASADTSAVAATVPLVGRRSQWKAHAPEESHASARHLSCLIRSTASWSTRRTSTARSPRPSVGRSFGWPLHPPIESIRSTCRRRRHPIWAAIGMWPKRTSWQRG